MFNTKKTNLSLLPNVIDKFSPRTLMGAIDKNKNNKKFFMR